ncbi:MAG: bifunctional adenosylcobinamide kinase/adenosylcobinamide-phosphate guanylyltransferase [Oscillospiraceae bacterium]|nr:bifunctional adenosylcobinamide kinase/adenosylcobinamide-phosphate guanylyltransferase [Oscillospiraceae bacterium]
MTVFIAGGAKSGKSSYAQDVAVALANGGKRYYVATMIPVDAEDQERIRLHLLDREGMGFETLERGRNLLSCLDQVDKDGAFLIDSVTSLLQNAIFPPEKNYEMDLAAARQCADELESFAKAVKHAVFVSDYIYSDGEQYDPATQMYRKCLAGIDRRLAKLCDVVLEASSGQIFVHKGEWSL